MLWIKLVKYWYKYTEMHGQQNVKKNEQIGFYNRDLKCLLRGTNWVFK